MHESHIKFIEGSLADFRQIIRRLESFLDLFICKIASSGSKHASITMGKKHASITMGMQTCINYYGEANMHQLLWGSKHASITMGKQTCINYYGETNMHQLLWGNKYIFKGIGQAKSFNFQLFLFILKMKLYVCRNLCENFRQIGQKMKKL